MSIIDNDSTGTGTNDYFHHHVILRVFFQFYLVLTKFLKTQRDSLLNGKRQRKASDFHIRDLELTKV